MLFSRLPAVGAVILLALPACTPSGTFPALTPRPVERALADSEEPPAPAAIPDQPDIAAKLDAFVAAGQRAQEDFDAALGPATRAAERAGPSGSDSWIEAQQAISRVEAARAATANALTELDAFAVERAKTAPLSPADMDRIRAATERLERISEAQQEAVAGLQARLKR